MRIQFASDLHLEFFESRFPEFRGVEPTDSDVLVLAGDIAKGSRVFDLFGNWHCPVVYVPGNHEFYGGALQPVLDEILERAGAYPNITVLNGSSVAISSVRFLGCTLWTDYELFGKECREEAMRVCGEKIYDHSVIQRQNGAPFRPIDACEAHWLQRQLIEKELAQPFQGKTILVTHHAPHPNSVHPLFSADITSASFTSNLTGIVGMADVCIHGHLHESFDYMVGETRVVSNPLGYCRDIKTASNVAELKRENLRFDPRLVIEV